MSTRTKLLMLGLSVLFLLGGTAMVGRSRAQAKTKKPDVVVAQVGNERLYLAELNRATAPYKYKYEKQGYDFSSASGRAQYQQLQASVLNNMIVQSLLDLGAAEKRVSVSAAELDKGYKKELGSRRKTEAAFIKELQSYGWTKAFYMSELKRQLIEEKFINRYIAKGKTGNSRTDAVNLWLSDRAGKTSIQVFFQVSSGGGDVLKDAEKAALDYYRKHGGADGATAQATNYGCHIQVDILRNGKIVKSYGYGSGQIYEL